MSFFFLFRPAEHESDNIFPIDDVTSDLSRRISKKGRYVYIKMTKYVVIALSDLASFLFFTLTFHQIGTDIKKVQ